MPFKYSLLLVKIQPKMMTNEYVKKSKLILIAATAFIISLVILLFQTPAKQIIMSTSCVVVIFMVTRPELFLTLFLIFRPCIDLLAEQKITGSVNSASVVTIFFIFIGSIILLRDDNIKIIKNNSVMLKVNKIFLCFLIISLISSINSTDFIISLADWLRLLSVIIIFNYAFLYFSERKIFYKLFIILLLSATIPVCLGLYQVVFSKGNHATLGLNRIYGTFTHPNVFAEYLVILFFVTIYFISVYKLNKVLLSAIILFLVIILLEIFSTYTRGVWIALAVSFVIFIIFHKGFKKLIYLAFIVIISLSFLQKIQARFADLKQLRPYEQSSWEWRIKMWSKTLGDIKENPVIGHGLGMYDKKFLFMAHNDYLRLAYEIGILGLITYLLFLLFILCPSMRRAMQEKNSSLKTAHITIASLLIAFLIMGAVDNLARSTLILLYMFCVIGALLGTDANINKKDAI
jgi:putative inorganic carbon (hco3(-)) transporter